MSKIVFDFLKNECWSTMSGSDPNSMIEDAIRNGNLQDVERLVGGYNETRMVCYWAASYGQLAIMQWARDRWLHWDRFTCAVAARKGHLEVLQWAVCNGCPWDRLVLRGAVKSGNLEVLKG